MPNAHFCTSRLAWGGKTSSEELIVFFKEFLVKYHEVVTKEDPGYFDLADIRKFFKQARKAAKAKGYEVGVRERKPGTPGSQKRRQYRAKADHQDSDSDDEDAASTSTGKRSAGKRSLGIGRLVLTPGSRGQGRPLKQTTINLQQLTRKDIVSLKS